MGGGTILLLRLVFRDILKLFKICALFGDEFNEQLKVQNDIFFF